MEQTIIDTLIGTRQTSRVSNLEASITKWSQPATAGDTGGPNNLPHGSSTWTRLASSGQFTFSPAKRATGKPWDTFYNSNPIVLNHPNTLPPDCFMYSIDIALPTEADVLADNAHEWEIEFCEAGLCYNMAWQDDGKEFRRFNQQAQNWFTVPGLPTPTRSPGKFVSHQGLFSINRQNKTVTHEGIFIDGIWFPVGITANAIQRWPTNVFYLHNAFQFDSDGKGSKCIFLLKNIGVAQL